ncbi:MAG: thiamine pyrophosphate-dependent enzyme [Eggerthellaceae bacterium]|jgi:indolepyruvate ferredoxin oxidoreductase alpha subunit
MTKKLLMGNEAFAHAALEAGVRVVAGYPGTPSSEIIETVAKLHAQGKAHGVHVEWSTNEKAALELLAGASYAGARCLYTSKQVGLNVSSDALMSLNYVGIKGGLVLVVADDPGPISSQTEQDTRRFAAFSKVPVFDPATPDEGFAMMKEAFELSERYHTPVILRPTTRIDHASTFFDIEEETYAREIPEGGFVKDPKWVIFPRRSFEAHGEINDRLTQIAKDYAREDRFDSFNPIYTNGVLRQTNPCQTNAQVGIVAGGISAAYALEALRTLEQRAQEKALTLPAYRFIQVGTPYPFPEEKMAKFCDGLTDLLVLEELDYVLEDELLKLSGKLHAPYTVHGKLSGETRTRGENSVDICIENIAQFFGCEELATVREESMNIGEVSDEPLPIRPPVLCSGCPHRGSFYAVKRAVGKREAEYCGDIGCYTLGNAAPLNTTDTCLCMGAGITMAQGFSVVEPNRKQIAFVGDSTFFASGLTGIANAAYNGHDITVVVLDNATTAMTGSQPHPGTGVTLMGPKNPPLSIEAVLRALNFACVVHADPLNLTEATAKAKEAIDFEGPSAIIFESPCIQLIRPGEAVHIDNDTCTGCKRCITEIGCPAIGFDLRIKGPRSKNRGQAYIDTSQCNGCNLCVAVCPFDAIKACRDNGSKEVSHA